jgi:mRNA deadenylase 3'-5' endonuclease subunit Ccr4
MPTEGIAILSWNIFNPDTVGLATMENPHYNHLSPHERFWEHRFPKIVQEIITADAPIVCFQEINKNLFGEVKDALAPLGYDATTHKKMQRNSLAIFYKHNRFTKIWEKNVKIKGFEKTLALGLRDGDRTLGVITCHLEGHPEKSLERLEQLERTFAEIKDLPHDALVVAGDFNAPLAEDGRRSSAVSSYMSQGEVPLGTTEWGHEVAADAGTIRPHGYSFASAYALGAAVSIALHGEGPALIDQIWFSESLELAGVRDVFLDAKFRSDLLAQGLPNEMNPSDHLPLGALFRWR